MSALIRCIGILFSVLGLVGCSTLSQANVPEASLTIFAASSLTDAFQALGAQFQAENPDVALVFNFAGSSQLAIQIVEGAPADVFASASPRQMQTVQAAGQLAGDPLPFATNTLIVIVPTSNPARLHGLADLARPGVKVVTAARGVPIRDYTDALLHQLMMTTAYGPEFYEGFYANIVSEEANVRQVALKVALGEADAAIVYASDVTSDIRADIQTLSIPARYAPQPVYYIAVLNDSEQTALARRFLDFVRSPTGQAVLREWGLASLPLEPSAVQVEAGRD